MTKMIFENWRRFLNENNSSEERKARTGALIWNDSTYRPVEDELLADVPTPLTPDFLRNIPQGHAGIILIKEIPSSSMQTYCLSIDFGPRDYCSKKDAGHLLNLRRKIGVFVNGQVKQRSFNKEYNFFDDVNKYLPDILRSNSKKIDRKLANQVGFASNIDFDKAAKFARSMTCKLYTIIPNFAFAGGNNCGSFALKVAAVAKGASPEIGKNIIGPDEVLPLMLNLGWLDFAQSIDAS